MQTKAMDAGTAFHAALASGLYPFILGDVVKAAIAGLGFPAAWTMVKPR